MASANNKKINYSSLEDYKKSIGSGTAITQDIVRAATQGISLGSGAAATVSNILDLTPTITSTVTPATPAASKPEENAKKPESVAPAAEEKEAPSKKDAAKTTMEQAAKAYDDYIKSDEYKQRMQEAENKARLDAAVQATVNPNFDIMSPQMIRDEKAEQLRAARDQAEADYNRSLDEEVMAADQAAIADLTDEERSMLEQYAVNRIGDQNRTLEMQGIMPTAQQQASALIQKYGQQRVDELAESLMRQQNADLATQVEEESRQFADEHGFLGSALTVPVAAMNGIAGTLGHFQGAARSTGRYRTLDANETGTLGDVFTGAVRGQVQQNIEGEDPNLLQKAASVGYQGVMSMADSIARGFLGGGPIGAGVLAATGTFSQVMSEASRNGATPAQAAALATVNSAIEAATEAIPLDELIKTAKGQGAGTVLKNVLRNAGIEATAEELSLVGTFLAEAAIMQEQSGYQQEVRNLILGGMSPEAARETANRNLLNEAVNTAFVAGLSGGMSSVGASVADAKSIPTPPTIEQVADMMLGDLVKPQQAVQEQSAPVVQQGESVAPEAAAQPAQGSENGGNDVLMRTMELMAGNDGKLSNKAAENILHDPDAIGRIMEQTGADITGTKSEQRAKLKAAMEQMFQNQNTETDTQTEIPATEAQSQAPQAAPQPDAVQPQVQTPQQQTPTEAPTAAQQGSAPQTDMQMGANNQSAVNGQIKGTGAAERNFSGVAAYEDMLEEGNTQKPRVGAVRDVEMPKTDSDGRRVTEFASNVVSAAVTPDPVADAVKSLVGDKQLSFDTRTNQQSLNNAADDIRARGADTVRTEIAQHAAEGVVKDGDIEKGMVLYAEYANDPKKQDAASGLIVDMAKLANMSGRNLQLFSLMKRMTPEGQLMTVKKNVNRYVEDINKNRSKRKQIQNGDTLVDEDLAKAFTDAKTDSERKAALDEIYKDVASKIKPTLGEMYDAWRNLAMLGNVKTHERNIFSTAAFQPYVEVKRAIGAALEKAAGIEQEKRTKAGLIGKEASALLKWAKQDAQTDSVMDLMDFSGTTGNEARGAIQDNRKILPGFVDKAAKKNMEIMEKSDMFFKKNEYARSLASFLKARGYTAEDVQNGTVPRGVLDEGRQLAVKEAQKATFNDSNKFSDAVVKLGKPKARDGWAIVNVFKKGILPFLRTPANVVVRATEYNPLAGVKTLLTAKKDIESGRKSTAEILDQVSASLTGTIATAVGMLLGSGMVPGIELVGAIEDEEELREGAQEYSLKIGDNYYGVGWLAPAMVPLFLGANLVRNGVLKTDENADAWDIAMAVVNLGVDTIEPILDLSMLSSLNDTIDKFANEDDPGDKVMAALLNTATSYLQQGLPTIFGQLEQATETEKSATFVNTDNKLEKAVKTTIANATKRIPGVDLYQTKKLDEFGQPVKNESDPVKRAIDALFNPSTKTTVKDDPLTKEIVRLNREGFDVSPNTAPKVVVYQDKNGEIHNDVRLTEEQYQTLAQTQGDTEKRILEKVINSDVFKTMTDAQKADTLRAVYDYARQTGMKAVFDDYDGMDTWVKDLTPDNELNAIMNRQITSTFTQAFDGLTDDYKRGNDTAQSLKELEQAYSNYSVLPREEKQQFMQDISGRVKYYVQARNLGVNTETFSDLYKKYRNIEGMNKEISEKAQLWSYMLEKAVDDGTITERQKDNLKQNMQYRYSFAAETEKFDEMIEAGVRTDAADQAVRAVKNVKGTGTDGAVRDIDKRGAIADLNGVSDAEKDAIMKAYMTDYDPDAKSPQKTELKYDYARKELGLTPQEYVDVYTVQLDGGKKAQKLDKWEAMGYTPEQAKMFYRLFSATGRTKIDVEEWFRSILQ